MKNTLFLTVLLLVSISLSAQSKKSFDLTLGDEFKDVSMTLPPTIFAKDGSGYYLFQRKMAAYVGIIFFPIKVSKEAYYLKKFDKDLRAVHSTRIELGKGRTKEEPLLAYSSLGNLHLFSTWQDRARRTHVLNHRFINRGDMSYPAVGKNIAEINYDGFPKYKYPTFEFERSRDSSKVLLHYQLPTKKEDLDKFQVHVFNEEMIQLWTSKFQLPYAENRLYIQSYKVSNEGRVFVLAKLYSSTKAKAYDYSYKLFVLSPGFEEPDEYDLGFDGKPLANLKLKMEPDDDLLCVGTYLEGERKNYNVKGIFFFKLDGTTLEVETKRFVKMPQEILDDLIARKPEAATSKRKKKRQEKAEDRVLNDIVFNEIVLRSDGGALLVGEISYSYTTSYYVSNSNGTGYWVYRTNYVRGNILALSVSPDGDIEQIDKVRKYQRQTDSNMMLSYGFAVTPENLRFVFNDRFENLTLGRGESPRLYVPTVNAKKKQSVTLVTLEQDGSTSREPILNVKEVGMYAFPMGAKQVSRSELIFILQKGKYRRLAKIEFR